MAALWELALNDRRRFNEVKKCKELKESTKHRPLLSISLRKTRKLVMMLGVKVKMFSRLVEAKENLEHVQRHLRRRHPSKFLAGDHIRSIATATFFDAPGETRSSRSLANMDEEEDFGLPAPKRRRVQEQLEPVAPPRSSRLFTPFRVSCKELRCRFTTDRIRRV